ncbi:MAG: glycosyltransferase family 39 protein [Pseudomonadota bacterium]
MTRTRWWSAAIVFLTPLLLFSTNLDGTWILDDHYQVERNPYIRSFQFLGRIFTTRVWQSTSNETLGSDIYRPVFLSSYMVDYQIFGLHPFGFHLANNLLHGINCLLLFFLIRRLLSTGPALLGTLLFAVHPIGVEAVTWIGGRMDLLMTLFALINLHLFLRIADPDRRTSLLATTLFLLSVPLGILSKEPFILVPFFTVGAWFLTRSRDRVAATHVALSTLLLILVTLITLRWRNQIVAREILGLISLENVRNAGELLKRFVLLFFVPSRSDFLSPYFSAPFRGSVDLPRFLLFLLPISYAAWRWRKNRPYLIGLSLFAAPLIPVTLVLDTLGVISERYFYLPLAGIAIWVATLVAPLFEPVLGSELRRAKKLLLACSMVWVALLAGRTVLRNREWRDEPRLFTSSMSQNRSNHLPHFFLAWHFHREGDLRREMLSYLEVLRRRPDDISSMNNLAVLLIDQREFSRAEPILARVMELDPKRAKTYYNFGYLAEARGDRKSAAESYRRAIALDPEYVLARDGLARVTNRAETGERSPSRSRPPL